MLSQGLNLIWIIKSKKKIDNLKLNGKNYKFCLLIEGNGNTSFIGDTRSGPINVEVINNEWIWDGVKQKREEKTNASAFGNMVLKKSLLNFEN